MYYLFTYCLHDQHTMMSSFDIISAVGDIDMFSWSVIGFPGHPRRISWTPFVSHLALWNKNNQSDLLRQL